MTTKEKYELIDKTKINPKVLEILQNMEKSSKNFTDEAVNAKIDGALDKLIEGFRANKPEALRTLPEAKKEVKKEKEKAQKKNEGKDFSDKKDTDDKTGLPKKDTLEERKEIIKKESESEKEARDRARKELEKEKEKAKDEVESQIEKLNRLILEDPALRGFNTGTAATGGGRSTPIIDAERKALPRGSRVSHKGWKNQYGASDGGRKYWENRENRSDRKSPEYETGKPYLAKGGNVYSSDDVYEVKMVQDGVELDSKFIRAKNKGEARMIFEDMYQEKYQDEFGAFELEIDVAKSRLADGGKTEPKEARFDVTLYDDDGEKYHSIVYAEDEEQALRKAENWHEIDSVQSDVMMITDYDGKNLYFAKGGYMEHRGTITDDSLESILKSDFPKSNYQMDYNEINGYRIYGQKDVIKTIQKHLLNEYGVISKYVKEGLGLPYLEVNNQFVDKYAKGGYMADGGEVGTWRENDLGDGRIELINSRIYISDNSGNYGRGRYDVYKRGDYDWRTNFIGVTLLASFDDLEEAKKYGFNNSYAKGGMMGDGAENTILNNDQLMMLKYINDRNKGGEDEEKYIIMFFESETPLTRFDLENYKDDLINLGYLADLEDKYLVTPLGKEYLKKHNMAHGGETESEPLGINEPVYFEVYDGNRNYGIIKFRKDGSRILETLLIGNVNAGNRRYMSYFTKDDLKLSLNRDFDVVNEVDEDYVNDRLISYEKSKPAEILVVKYPYPELAKTADTLTIIKGGEQVFDYDPVTKDFTLVSIGLSYPDQIELDDFLEDSKGVSERQYTPELIKVIEVIKENEDISEIVNELKSKGLIQKYNYTMADGGEVDFSKKMAKMRSAYENLDMIVKSKIAMAIGIDNAVSIMDYDYVVHPFHLIKGAVSSGLLEIDEINGDLVGSAIQEAERIDEDYRDSGEGIGSSDITYFTKSMLRDAGYKTEFINHTLKRVDDDGNELVINKYQMDF